MTTISTLLKQAQANDLDESQRKAEAITQQYEKFISEINRQVKAFCPELLDYISGGFKYESNSVNLVISVYGQVVYPGLPVLLICASGGYGPVIEVYLAWSSNGKSGRVSLDKGPEAVGEFLYKGKKVIEEEQKQEQVKKIESLLGCLGQVKKYNYRVVETLAEAEAACRELCDLDPVQESRWKSALSEWQALYEKRQARRKAEQEERERYKSRQDAERARYKEVYTAWWLKRLEVIKGNLAAFEKLQEHLNQPYTLVDFRYGFVGEDDEGQKYAEELKVTILSADGSIEPNRAMPVVNRDGRVENTLFYKQTHIG
ncbi:MAG: hypothetical protein ACREIQ_05215, partial [Nitrospiria bacterium]